MIRIEDLEFSFADGEFRLAIERLEIAAGEHVACIGPSGTGKTTLVNLVAGILVPERGSVRVGEHVVSGLSDTERRRIRISEIGLVFQEFELLAYMTAWENILLPYRVAPHLALTREVRERARGLAEAMGLAETLARRPRRLSQGERQRVAICRALVTSPRLVMCDEPTGNLDPDTARTSLDLLFEQVTEQQATLLMVTHNHDVLGRFDRTLDMAEIGRDHEPRG
jgi:putative ABC transport system ATP-binding protein